jgi:hypothetical protein
MLFLLRKNRINAVFSDNKKILYVKTNFKETNWTTESEYVFLDKSTLLSTITGDSNATITFKKLR